MRPCRKRYRPEPDLGDRLDERGVLQTDQRRRRPTARPAGAAAPRRTPLRAWPPAAPTRRSMPGARRRAVRISWIRGGSTSPGWAVTALRVSSWRKRGTPAPRSTIRRRCCRVQSAVGQRGDQPRRLLLVERFQLDVEDRRRPRRIERVPARDQDHRAGDALGRQEPQQVDRRRVGPVQVLDQHQGSASTPPCGRARRRGPGASVGGARGRPPPGRDHRSSVSSPSSGASRGTVSSVETGIVQPGLQFGEPLLRRLVRVEAEQLLEHAPDGPQRDIAVIGRTVGLEHGAALEAHVRRQLRGQRRLPDAGHAPDDDHRLLGPRRALGCRGRGASR